MITLRDALREKLQANAEFDARLDARDAEAKRVADILQSNPEIGVLNGGKFYTIRDGVYNEASDPQQLVQGEAA